MVALTFVAVSLLLGCLGASASVDDAAPPTVLSRPRALNNHDIVSAVLNAAAKAHQPPVWYTTTIDDHPQSVTRHRGPLLRKKPVAQKHSKRWILGFTGISLALSAIGIFGGSMTYTICKLTGVTSSLAGKISCWSLGGVFGLMALFGGGLAAVQYGIGATIVNGMVGVAAVVTKRSVDLGPLSGCGGVPFSVDFMANTSYYDVASPAADRMKSGCGKAFANMHDTLPGSPVLAGTNLTARYIDLVFWAPPSFAPSLPGSRHIHPCSLV